MREIKMEFENRRNFIFYEKGVSIDYKPNNKQQM